MKKQVVTLTIIIILLSMFTQLFEIPPIVEAQDVPDVWMSDPSIVTGLTDIGSKACPTIAYNLTGDNTWTLISGDNVGGFYGFQWNGTQWNSNSTVIAGLPSNIGGGASGAYNYSRPYIAFNVTGDGNWTLICGRYNGDFRGFYWNGTQWVEKPAYVQGLGDVGIYSAPTMAFNVTGDGNWTLIAGEDEGFYGFYWNGTQWVADPSRVTGLHATDGESEFRPRLAYNMRGDNRWCLIVGSYVYPSYGYEWNGNQWIYYGLVVANFVWDQVGNQGNCCPTPIYNFTGENKWHLIVGGEDGKFYGLTMKPPTSPDQLVEIGRGLLNTGSNYVYAFKYYDGYLYGGTQTIPGKAVKISAGTLEEVDSITLASEDGYTSSGCVEIVGNYLYLGNWKSPSTAIIVKVDLTTFTEVSALTLTLGGVTDINDLVSDGTYLYAACYPTTIIKIDLESFTETANLTLPDNPNRVIYEDGYLYVGTYNGYLYKIDTSTFSLDDTLDIDGSMTAAIDCLASKGDGWLYAGYTDSSPTGYIRKVNLTTFSNDARLQVGASGSGIYVDRMEIIGDILYFLDSMFIRTVYLPTFSLSTSRGFIDTSWDLASDGYCVYMMPGTAPATVEKIYFTGATLHPVTVTANPSVSVKFKIDGNVYTTPYVTNLPEGSHTFEVASSSLFTSYPPLQCIFDHWTVDGKEYSGVSVTLSISSETSIVMNYNTGIYQLVFDDDFETGDLSKQSGIARWTAAPDKSLCKVEASADAKYAGSYGMKATAYMAGYGGYAFAYKNNAYQRYVKVNFMLYVPSDVASHGWFALIRGGSCLNPTETGFADPPYYTTLGLGWSGSKFKIVYWIGDLEYLSSFSGFQFDTWYNITMFVKKSTHGFYAIWVNNTLRWYRWEKDTTLWGTSRTYLGVWAYASFGNYISAYIDEEKIYTFTDPTYYALNVTSEPFLGVTVTVDGTPFTTPFSMRVFPGTHQIALVDVFPTVNETSYSFTKWVVENSETIEYDSATFTLNVDENKNLTAYFATGITLRPSEVPAPSELTYVLPLSFWVIMVLLFLFGMYLFSQREAWKMSIPLLLVIFWLLIFKPRVPVSEMPIAILRLFTVPPWHTYCAIALSVIAVGLLLNKLRGG